MKKKVIKKSIKFSSRRQTPVVNKDVPEYSSKSYKNFLYGGITVILLIAVALGLFRIYSLNSRKNIAEEGLKVSSVDENNNQSGNLSANVKGTISADKYTVTENDSLWKISEKVYNDGYKWVEIAKANNLKNPGLIYKGDKLTIPKVKTVVQAAENPKADQTTVASNNKIQGKEYTVQKGDYLWKIALLAYGDGYKWTSIARENNLENPSVIHSGNKLAIPR